MKTIKRTISVIVISCMMANAAFANIIAPEFTKELYDMCTSTDSEISEKCSGYIWGVGDMLNAAYGMNDGKISYEFNIPKYTKLNFVTVVGAMQVLIQQYPDKLKQPAVTTVIEAYQLLGVWKYKAKK